MAEKERFPYGISYPAYASYGCLSKQTIWASVKTAVAGQAY